MPLDATFFDQTCFPYLDGYPKDYRDLPKQMAKVHWSSLALSLGIMSLNQISGTSFACAQRSAGKKRPARSSWGLGCPLFDMGTYLRRIDNFLIDLAQTRWRLSDFWMPCWNIT